MTPPLAPVPEFPKKDTIPYSRKGILGNVTFSPIPSSGQPPGSNAEREEETMEQGLDSGPQGERERDTERERQIDAPSNILAMAHPTSPTCAQLVLIQFPCISPQRNVSPDHPTEKKKNEKPATPI